MKERLRKKATILKRRIAMLLAALMVVTLLPTSGLVADAANGTDIGWEYAVITEKTSGGYNLTDPSGSNHLGSKVTVTYTPEGGTATTWEEGSLKSNILTRTNQGIVTITAAPGYYISYVVLACGNNDKTANPFRCRTVTTDSAFGYALATSTLNSVQLKVADLWAHANHDSNDDDYFLMIMLEPLPDPIYVGYDSGVAGSTEITADPVVKGALSGNGVWLNNYFTAKYDPNQSDNTYVTPIHTSLEVSAAAIAEADALGYTFGGWEVVYYRTYYETGTRVDGVNYLANTFTQQIEVGSSVIGEGVDVTLYTHAVLTAVWVPKADVQIVKEWDDANNQDGKRPDTLEVDILADGVVVDTVTLTGTGNTWSEIWSGPKQDEDGGLIEYTVREAAVDGYRQEITKETVTEGDKVTYVFTLDNSRTPEVIDITVAKIWADNDNQDGIRPTSAVLELTKNGVATGKTVTLNMDNEWTGRFEGLPKYENGVEIQYGLTEANVAGYTFSFIKDAATGNLVATNTHEYYKTSLTVTKVWDDANDQDGKRSDSITVQLLANGVAVPGYTLELNETNNWTGTFTDLAMNTKGSFINYTVQELSVDGYTSMVVTTRDEDEGTFTSTVTNTRVPEITSVSVTKVWDDADNQDGIRPASVVIKLLADDVDTGKTLTLDATNNWKGAFTELAKYADGELIKYTVEEAEVTGYTYKVTGDAATGYTVTNTHETETIEYSVLKVWDDEDAPTGTRPGSITVHLLANGKHTGQTKVLSSDNSWTDSWTGLAKYADGVEIVYSVAEEVTAANNLYTTSYSYSGNSATITNTYTNEKTELIVLKVWDDAHAPAGTRPASVTVTLYADGVSTEKSLTLNGENNWTGTFADLTVYKDGQKIVYTVVESDVTGYKDPQITTDEITGVLEVTNTYDMPKVSVSVNKVWSDSDNAEGLRPASVTVRLMRGTVEVSSVVLSADNNWAHTFSDLDKYINGREVIYTVTEDAVANYTTTITGDQTAGYTVTNSRQVEKTSVTVSKVWADNDNQDGKRPGSVTIRLLANGQDSGKSLTLEPANGWKGTFTDLQKYSGGAEIVYTVTEDAIGENYTTAITGDAASGFTVTNSRTPEIIAEYTVTKVWDDQDAPAGTRPASVTVHLLANGEHTQQTKVLNADNEWKATWTNLDKYINGKEIAYTVVEEAIDKYTPAYSYSGNAATVTNTYTNEKVYVSVLKIWDDAHAPADARPETVTVRLWKKQIDSTGDAVDTGKTLELSAANNWEASFTDLDKYEDTKELVYSVTEDAVANYTTEIKLDEKTGIYEIINTYNMPKVSVSVTKEWKDSDNAEGLRPASVTVRLMRGTVEVSSAELSAANNWTHTFTDLDQYINGREIVYTVTEDAVANYTTTITGDQANGYTVTNSRQVELISIPVSKVWADNDNQDGKRPANVTVRLWNGTTEVGSKVLSPSNGWKDIFVDLQKYANGAVINYTVTEDTIGDNYTTAVTGDAVGGFTVTNSRTPETIDYTVTKVWDDADAPASVRPASITVHLLANGQHTGQTKVLSADNEWKATWTGMPKYADGKEIVYTVVEAQARAISQYITGYTYNGYNATITNTFINPKTSLKVLKVWDDAHAPEGTRPESVTVELLADGNATGKTLVLNKDNGWYGEFTDLTVYKAGSAVVYTVEEKAVDATKYNVSLKVDELTGILEVTNTYKNPQVSVSVSKVWSDSDNLEGLRPDSVTVQLLANGVAISGKTLTLDETNSWTASFTELDKFRNGVEVVYTVEEEAVEYYTTEITGGAADDGTNAYEYTITNSRTPEKVSVTVNKIWNDDNDRDGIRPESITVVLCKDGEEKDSIELTKDSNWSGIFTDLPKYENGQIVNYTIDEVIVPEGYTSQKGEPVVNADGSISVTVINTHEPETIEYSVSKVWDDADDQDGIRPEEITVYLLADGEYVGTVTLKASENWTVSLSEYFGDSLKLYKNDNGDEIIYQVSEKAIDGYTPKYEYDFTTGVATITNTHVPETTSVAVMKNWNDGHDRDGLRPDSITVHLWADNVDTGMTLTITEADAWVKSFRDLPKYRDGGVEIVYTITEDEIAGYSTVIGEDERVGFMYDVTNTHEVSTTSVTVTKIWDDANNQDGRRSGSVTVQLTANGELVDPMEFIVLSDENNWTYTWTDMYVNAAGQPIRYSVVELRVPEGYIPEVETTQNADGTIQLDLTNVHNPETKELVIRKLWNDNGSETRPESIEVVLFKNLVQYGDDIVLTSENGWKASLVVPVYENGAMIDWTVEEKVVPEGYTVTYDQAATTIINTLKQEPAPTPTIPEPTPELPMEPAPDTGDHTMMVVWGTLSGLSGMAAIGTASLRAAFYKRRKNEDDEHEEM